MIRFSATQNPAGARAALERTVGEGGVVLFGSDGVYGLGCDPLSAEAIERIHGIKGRDEGKPSAVMYFAALAMRELLGDLGPASSAVIGALLPGPFTLVLDNPELRYPLACGERPGQLGVRLIGGPLAGTMTPLFQTSANRSGEPPVAELGALDDELVGSADLVLDMGALSGAPSTVIDLTRIDADGSWALLREGAAGAAETERRIAEVLRPDGSPRSS